MDNRSTVALVHSMVHQPQAYGCYLDKVVLIMLKTWGGGGIITLRKLGWGGGGGGGDYGEDTVAPKYNLLAGHPRYPWLDTPDSLAGHP